MQGRVIPSLWRSIPLLQPFSLLPLIWLMPPAIPSTSSSSSSSSLLPALIPTGCWRRRGLRLPWRDPARCSSRRATGHLFVRSGYLHPVPAALSAPPASREPFALVRPLALGGGRWTRSALIITRPPSRDQCGRSPQRSSLLHRLHIAVPPPDGVTGRNDVRDTQAPNAERVELLLLPAEESSSPVALLQTNPCLLLGKEFGLAALP